MYQIDEVLARKAKELASKPYTDGSATAQYKQLIEQYHEAAEKCAAGKVPQDMLDDFADKYAARLAAAFNRCVSLNTGYFNTTETVDGGLVRMSDLARECKRLEKVIDNTLNIFNPVQNYYIKKICEYVGESGGEYGVSR